MYWVIKSRGSIGVKVADVPLLDTVPATGMLVLVGISCIVAIVAVSGSMVLLKFTVTAVFAETPVALLAGLTEATVAEIRSAPVPVVKLTVTGEGSTLPLKRARCDAAGDRDRKSIPGRAEDRFLCAVKQRSQGTPRCPLISFVKPLFRSLLRVTLGNPVLCTRPQYEVPL